MWILDEFMPTSRLTLLFPPQPNAPFPKGLSPDPARPADPRTSRTHDTAE